MLGADIEHRFLGMCNLALAGVVPDQGVDELEVDTAR
jgi:hypothetical protein